MIAGSCFCKKIRYEISERDDRPYRVVNCHCTMCRRTSAAPFVTWIVVPRDAFHYRVGEAKTLQSSEKGSRHFCPDCGTPLAFMTEERPAHIDVTVCSLEDPDKFIPVAAVHEDTRLNWLKVT